MYGEKLSSNLWLLQCFPINAFYPFNQKVGFLSLATGESWLIMKTCCGHPTPTQNKNKIFNKNKKTKKKKHQSQTGTPQA